MDAAVELSALGHHVHIFTAHHDRKRCFEETIDGVSPTVLSLMVSSHFYNCLSLIPADTRVFVMAGFHRLIFIVLPCLQGAFLSQFMVTFYLDTFSIDYMPSAHIFVASMWQSACVSYGQSLMSSSLTKFQQSYPSLN